MEAGVKKNPWTIKDEWKKPNKQNICRCIKPDTAVKAHQRLSGAIAIRRKGRLNSPSSRRKRKRGIYHQGKRRIFKECNIWSSVKIRGAARQWLIRKTFLSLGASSRTWDKLKENPEISFVSPKKLFLVFRRLWWTGFHLAKLHLSLGRVTHFVG